MATFDDLVLGDIDEIGFCFGIIAPQKKHTVGPVCRYLLNHGVSEQLPANFRVRSRFVSSLVDNDFYVA